MGDEFFIPTYNRPETRADKEVERKIYLLRENNPGITLKETCDLVAKQGISISVHGIHQIWNRFGLIGSFVAGDRRVGCEVGPEEDAALARARILLERGNKNDLRHAAELINELPGLSSKASDVLEMIPAELLNLRKRYFKLVLCKSTRIFKINALKELRDELKKNNLLFTSILAGLELITQLHYLKSPEEEIALAREMEDEIRGLKVPMIRFKLNIFRAIAHARKMESNQARTYFNKTRHIIRRMNNATILVYAGDYYSAQFKYDKSIEYYSKALEIADEDSVDPLRLRLTLSRMITGDFMDQPIPSAKHPPEGRIDLTLMRFCVRVLRLMYDGDLRSASASLREMMEVAQKGYYRNYVYFAIAASSAIKMARGDIEAGQEQLKRHLSVLRKLGLLREALLVEATLGILPDSELTEKNILFKILQMLNKADITRNPSDFKRARNMARRNHLMGFFHRHLAMKVELVRDMLKAGIDTGLPRAFLAFPAFADVSVQVRVNLLGRITASKSEKGEQINLSSKEGAILSILSSNISKPGDYIPLDRVEQYIWSNKDGRTGRIKAYIGRITSRLGIREDLLDTGYRGDVESVINRGVHFNRDIDDFRTICAHAKSLLSTKMNEMALQEYRNAFSLIRDIPLKGCYDTFSEDQRTYIISIINRIRAEIFYIYPSNDYQEFDSLKAITENSRLDLLLELSPEGISRSVEKNT
ncbi:MAG: hypothetical protein GF388_08900 [Candidatus Aegiribacteria sp.]|nr:hypothetical protein [Candidatus Aegiribacteria sp.]